MSALDFMALLREEKRKVQEESMPTAANSSRPSSKELAPSVGGEPPLIFPTFAFDPRPLIDLGAASVGAIEHVSYFSDFVTREESKAICEAVFAVPQGHRRWVTLKGRKLQCWGGVPPGRDAAFEPESLPDWLAGLGEALVACGVFPPTHPPNHVLVNVYRNGEGILAHTDGPTYAPRTATLSLSLNEDSELDASSDASFSAVAAHEEARSVYGAVMTFTPRQRTSEVGVEPKPSAACEVVLRPRSLVVFREGAYSDHLHSINALDGTEAADQLEESETSRAPAAEVSVLPANSNTARVRPGGKIMRPSVRVSLTFRHLYPPAALAGKFESRSN